MAKTALVTGATESMRGNCRRIKNLGDTSAITANLKLMSDTKRAIEKFLAERWSLHSLFLKLMRTPLAHVV